MSYLPENEPIVQLSVPCDEAHILIDCIPRQYERTGLSIAVGKSALTIIRTDEYPIQVRRLDRKQPHDFIGLERPLEYLILDYDPEDTEWHVPTDMPVRDFDTMDIFASLITGYTKGKLLRNATLGEHIA